MVLKHWRGVGFGHCRLGARDVARGERVMELWLVGQADSVLGPLLFTSAGSINNS
jgi:hypothetical protein